MPLTKEALLIPRYKVKDKYPGMEAEPFYIGQIITLKWHKEVDGDDIAEGYIHVPIKHMPRSFMWQSFFDLFPNIFQPLPWWSDRKLFELPEYVMCIKTPDQKITPGMVLKVAWCSESWGTDHVHTVILDTNCYEPATEEEYTAYINQKQQ